MTYKKPLKVFNGTTLMGIQFGARDTATSRIGSDAISAFEAHKTIETEGTDKKILVPFHAVKKANYGIFTEDAERTDPYCGGGTEPVGEVWYTGTLGECEGDIKDALLAETSKADTNELNAHPNDYNVALNGTPLTTYNESQGGATTVHQWSNDAQTIMFGIATNNKTKETQINAGVPCDYTESDVAITVAKK